MSEIVREIARQIKAMREANKLPSSITMSFDTKCAMIHQLPAHQHQWFQPAPLGSTEPSKFRGLLIEIDYTIPYGEVRVA